MTVQNLKGLCLEAVACLYNEEKVDRSTLTTTLPDDLCKQVPTRKADIYVHHYFFKDYKITFPDISIDTTVKKLKQLTGEQLKMSPVSNLYILRKCKEGKFAITDMEDVKTLADYGVASWDSRTLQFLSTFKSYNGLKNSDRYLG